MRLILHGVPRPITAYCPEIDPRLVRVVDRALEKDPDRRFQEVAAVRKELASIRLNPVGVEPRSTRQAPTAPRDQQAPATPSPVAVRRTPSPAVRDQASPDAGRINEHMVAAEQAFASRNFDAAIESCQQVLLLDASEARALALIDRAEAIRTAIANARTAYNTAIRHRRCATSIGRWPSIRVTPTRRPSRPRQRSPSRRHETPPASVPLSTTRAGVWPW